MKTLVTLLLACCFGSAMAQSNLPACLGTDVTRWTACFGTERIVGRTYIGEFKDGIPSGQGTYTYDYGDKYVGEFKYGYANGQGTYTYGTGEKYLGEHRYGRPNGKGITFRSDGTIKESGIYENGVLVC